MHPGPRQDQGYTVHPRTRGEHLICRYAALNVLGSSPHTRGTFSKNTLGLWIKRFIPAHAGNMRFRARTASLGAVHPRTRGEHYCTEESALLIAGSSPHTRGTSYHVNLNGQHIRFIPAHAGNIFAPRKVSKASTVHPRTRGEHISAASTCRMAFGSSPHTRGTYRQRPGEAERARFIPAHAGNMHRGRNRRMASPVHPRTRGEHCRKIAREDLENGSSPHTRGTFLPAIWI